MIKIDNNIPQPRRDCYGRPAKYPFRELRPGQSFFAPGVTTYGLGGASDHWRKSTGWTFVTRKVVEDGIPGVRVWRVK